MLAERLFGDQPIALGCINDHLLRTRDKRFYTGKTSATHLISSKIFSHLKPVMQANFLPVRIENMVPRDEITWSPDRRNRMAIRYRCIDLMRSASSLNEEVIVELVQLLAIIYQSLNPSPIEAFLSNPMSREQAQWSSGSIFSNGGVPTDLHRLYSLIDRETLINTAQNACTRLINEYQTKKWCKIGKAEDDYRLVKIDEAGKAGEVSPTTVDEIFTPTFDGRPIVTGNERLPKDPLFISRVKFGSDHQIHLLGDLHSNLETLLLILVELYRKNILVGDFELAPKHVLVFLGDLIDYGPTSLEILYLVFRLQNKNPNQVIILNGNHEDRLIYEGKDRIGLIRELLIQIGNVTPQGTVKSTDYLGLSHELKDEIDTFRILLMMLPSAVFLTHGEKTYHLSHGGIHIEFDRTSEGEIVSRIFNPDDFIKSECDHGLFILPDDQHEERSAYSGFKWSEFDRTLGNQYRIPLVDPRASQSEKLRTESRFAVGVELVEEYLRYNGLTAILSGHQDYSPLILVPFRTVGFRTSIEGDQEKYRNDDNYTRKKLLTLNSIKKAKLKYDRAPDWRFKEDEHEFETADIPEGVIALATSASTMNKLTWTDKVDRDGRGSETLLGEGGDRDLDQKLREEQRIPFAIYLTLKN